MGWSKVKSNKSKFVKPDDLKDARKYDAVQAAGDYVQETKGGEAYPNIKRRNLRIADRLDGESDVDRIDRLKKGWNAQMEAQGMEGRFFEEQVKSADEIDLDKMLEESRAAVKEELEPTNPVLELRPDRPSIIPENSIKKNAG